MAKGKTKSGDNTRAKIFTFIVKFKLAHQGNTPTFDEILQGTGIASKNTVYAHLQTMNRDGVIELPIPGASRINIPGAHWLPPEAA